MVLSMMEMLSKGENALQRKEFSANFPLYMSRLQAVLCLSSFFYSISTPVLLTQHFLPPTDFAAHLIASFFLKKTASPKDMFIDFREEKGVGAGWGKSERDIDQSPP